MHSFFTTVGSHMTLLLGLVQFFLVFFQLGLAYVLYSIAIKRVSALDAIIYPVIEPILNPILALFFIGETMTSTAKVGGLFSYFWSDWARSFKRILGLKKNPSNEGFSD